MCPSFVNSSLAPVVLFRRRLKSVADVLEGIRSRGFTQSRWDALLGYREAVCRHGPCGPISSLLSWEKWILPDLHGFYKWVFDSLGLLKDFLKRVVVSRRDIGIRKWTWWLREDLSSRPYAWLRPDFVPPSPFLVVRILRLGLLVFWLNLISHSLTHSLSHSLSFSFSLSSLTLLLSLSFSLSLFLFSLSLSFSMFLSVSLFWRVGYPQDGAWRSVRDASRRRTRIAGFSPS